jgi:tripartite-type tricarboxylate transporter receptor subunit TctC
MEAFMFRKTSLGVVLWAIAGIIATQSALAQQFPDKSIRLIVPQPAGGVTDTLARSMAPEMAKRLGQPVLVENRSGGGGAIAGDFVSKAPSDGYTVGFFPNSTMVVLPLVAKVPYSPSEVKPLAKLYGLDLYAAVRTDFPTSNLTQLTAYSKSNPGKLNYGTTGLGSPLHLGWELFLSQSGISMTHIPYRGGPEQITALLGGHIQVAILGSFEASNWLKQGKIKVIASMSSKRNPALPDVPTISESGYPGFEAPSWTGLWVPAATPTPIAEIIVQAAMAALRAPAIQERMRTSGLTPLGEDRTSEIVLANEVETQRWLQVIKKLGPESLK